MRNGEWLALYETEAQALEGLFLGVNICLKEVRLTLKDIDSFIFCHGPGSMMGIRIVAMALRIWKTLPEHSSKPVFVYNALDLSVALLKSDGKNSFGVATTAGRKKYFLKLSEPNEVTEVQEDEFDNIDLEAIYMLPLKSGAPLNLSKKLIPFEYSLKKATHLFGTLEGELFQSIEMDDIDALQLNEQSFVKWQGTRHRKN